VGGFILRLALTIIFLVGIVPKASFAGCCLFYATDGKTVISRFPAYGTKDQIMGTCFQASNGGVYSFTTKTECNGQAATYPNYQADTVYWNGQNYWIYDSSRCAYLCWNVNTWLPCQFASEAKQSQNDCFGLKPSQ
jgi:hypothetical protein